MRWERERTNNCAPPPFYIFVLKVVSFFLFEIGDVKMPYIPSLYFGMKKLINEKLYRNVDSEIISFEANMEHIKIL